jgi:hypothetical protein
MECKNRRPSSTFQDLINQRSRPDFRPIGSGLFDTIVGNLGKSLANQASQGNILGRIKDTIDEGARRRKEEQDKEWNNSWVSKVIPNPMKLFGGAEEGEEEVEPPKSFPLFDYTDRGAVEDRFYGERADAPSKYSQRGKMRFFGRGRPYTAAEWEDKLCKGENSLLAKKKKAIRDREERGVPDLETPMRTSRVIKATPPKEKGDKKVVGMFSPNYTDYWLITKDGKVLELSKVPPRYAVVEDAGNVADAWKWLRANVKGLNYHNYTYNLLTGSKTDYQKLDKYGLELTNPEHKDAIDFLVSFAKDDEYRIEAAKRPFPTRANYEAEDERKRISDEEERQRREKEKKKKEAAEKRRMKGKG